MNNLIDRLHNFTLDRKLLSVDSIDRDIELILTPLAPSLLLKTKGARSSSTGLPPRRAPGSRCAPREKLAKDSMSKLRLTDIRWRGRAAGRIRVTLRPRSHHRRSAPTSSSTSLAFSSYISIILYHNNYS